MGKIDKWTLGAAIMVIAVLIIFYSKDSKAGGTTGGLVLITGAVLITWASRSKAIIVENRYRGTIYVKTERNGNAVPVGPMQTPSGIDGIATPAGGGNVFKVRNGVYLWIDEAGQVREVSPLSAAINPGWVAPQYFSAYDRQQWAPLIQIAQQIQA